MLPWLRENTANKESCMRYLIGMPETSVKSPLIHALLSRNMRVNIGKCRFIYEMSFYICRFIYESQNGYNERV